MVKLLNCEKCGKYLPSPCPDCFPKELNNAELNKAVALAKGWHRSFYGTLGTGDIAGIKQDFQWENSDGESVIWNRDWNPAEDRAQAMNELVDELGDMKFKVVVYFDPGEPPEVHAENHNSLYEAIGQGKDRDQRTANAICQVYLKVKAN